MNQAATLAADDKSPSAGFPNVFKQQSLLFPALFNQLDLSRRLSVFEVGGALPETVEFFSAYRCKLHFADLYSETLVLSGQQEIDEREMVEAFTELLDFPQETRLDLCLFWDFLNYLDDPALRAFNKALSPYLHERTLGHGFAVRTVETALKSQQYGLDKPHMFTVRPASHRGLTLYPHSQAILINLLPCFDIDRGMLLPDGRLEVLLKVSTGQ